MQTLHIAVGVLIDAQGRALIAERRVGTAGAGKWEFPGGKRVSGETIEQALARELDEELGVQTGKLRPMLRFQHDYTARRVLLDIWQVLDWTGEAYGREGQTLVWCEPEQLLSYDLLSANKHIVDAIRLPATYVITPEPESNKSGFLRTAKAAAEAGERLFRLRAWNLSDQAYEALASDLVKMLNGYGASLMLDRSAEMVKRVGAAGLHLSASALAECEARPVPTAAWFAVSCRRCRDESTIRCHCRPCSCQPVPEEHCLSRKLHGLFRQYSDNRHD